MEKTLDGKYIRRLNARLASIPDDARQRWGTLDKAGLIRHLVWVVHTTTGKAPPVPFYGNWLTVNVVGPLVLRGVIPIPKNVRPPRQIREQQGFTMESPGDLVTLRVCLDEYLALVQSGELPDVAHPVFGKLGVDGWAMFHLRHFEHHCKQFGV